MDAASKAKLPAQSYFASLVLRPGHSLQMPPGLFSEEGSHSGLLLQLSAWGEMLVR